jgi:hypothetical protein
MVYVHIHLVCLTQLYSNRYLQVTLWGQRAKKFAVKDIDSGEATKPILVLFVGYLAKHLKGTTAYT